MKLSKLIVATFTVLLAFLVTACSEEKSDTVRWINATHGVLIATNQGDINIYGGEKLSEETKKAFAESLNTWWDITNKDQLIETVIELAETKAPKELAAWDYSRAFSLLSQGYLAGYITREQALEMSFLIAEKIQPLYHSWDDFFEGYFKGYELWSENNSEIRRQNYQLLKSYENSPYNLPWNLELKKDWN